MRTLSAYCCMAAISLLVGCATSDAKLQKEKLAIQERVKPSSVLGCRCPAYSPDGDGLNMEGSGPYFKVDGEFGEYPAEFKYILKESENFGQALSTYTARISHSSSKIDGRTDWHCWTGVCPAYEYFITDLTDETKTWVFLSQVPKSYAHKCTYAEDPNAWTTQSCPTKGPI